jgi:Domain of unknown function (DUF4149)
MNKVQSVLVYVRKLFVAIWIGKIVFFATCIAPTVFKVLERGDAAALQAQIFPKYFGLGLIATSGVLLISLMTFFSDRASTRAKIAIGLSAVAVGIYINLLYSITPDIMRLQPEVLLLPKGSLEPVALEFANIHSISTTLNLIVLILGLIALAVV